MLLRLLPAALVVLLSGPAQAMVAPPGDPTPHAAAAAVRTHLRAGLDGFLGELERFSAPHQQIIAETTALLTDLNQGVGRAMALNREKASPATAGAWHKAWASGVERRMTTLQSSVGALPTFDEAKVTALAGADADPAMLKAFRTLPDQLKSLVAGNDRLGRQVVELAGATARGDSQARARLAPYASRLNASALEAENAYMRAAMLGAAPDHPQYFLLKSAMASNDALRTLMVFQGDALSGAPVDRVRAAREMLDHAGAAQDAAAAIEPAAAAMLAAADEIGLAAALPEARAALQRTLPSYGRSAAVEHEIAVVLLRAVRLLTAETVDWTAMAGALAPLSTLVEQRAAADNERRALLSP